MDFESWKMSIVKGVASNNFTRYQKILWTCLLGCKKLLNFICLPIKFHNCVYLNLHDSRLENGNFLIRQSSFFQLSRMSLPCCNDDKSKYNMWFCEVPVPFRGETGQTFRKWILQCYNQDIPRENGGFVAKMYPNVGNGQLLGEPNYLCFLV